MRLEQILFLQSLFSLHDLENMASDILRTALKATYLLSRLDQIAQMAVYPTFKKLL